MTNWELGNDIMCSLIDKMNELAKECKTTHPQVSELLEDVALDMGPIVNRYMNDDENEHGMCPTRPDSYKYFDGTSSVKFPLRRGSA